MAEMTDAEFEAERLKARQERAAKTPAAISTAAATSEITTAPVAAEMSDDEFEAERLFERERREARAQRQALAAEEARQARSEEMGGAYPLLADQQTLDLREIIKAEQDRATEQKYRPAFLPELPPVDVNRVADKRASIATVGGDAEDPYLEAREDIVPFLRPTRIESVQRGPGVERIIERTPLGVPYRPGEYDYRTPTESEELLESFARQPVMTQDAARALAAGEEDPDRKVGLLEGGTFESPFGAVFRSLPASVEGAAVSAYRKLPRKELTPVEATPTGLVRAGLETAAGGVEEAADLLGKYLSKLPGGAGEFASKYATGTTAGAKLRALSTLATSAPEKAIKRAGVGAVRGAIRGMELLDAQVEPGQVVQDLDTIGDMTPLIPAPRAVPDKPLSQRVLEGEFILDVIKDDKELVKAYDREFGVLSGLAQTGTGLILGMQLPFTPAGVVTRGLAHLGVSAKAAKVVTNQLTKRAVSKAEEMLASRIVQDFTKSTTPISLKSLNPADIEKAIIKHGSDLFGDSAAITIKRVLDDAVDAGDLVLTPLSHKGREFKKLIKEAVENAKADLAMVTPRTDLVRVSPSYAVPQRLAPAVTKEAAKDVADLRKLAEQTGQPFTRAEEIMARDAAVVRAAQSEAKRLDEVGQFQVLLDGLNTPRAWDTELFRAARALRNPEEAMKRAAVTAAEDEIKRHGMNALRNLRKDFEAGTKAGKSVSDIIEEVGQRELSALNLEEILKLVLDTSYGEVKGGAIAEKLLAAGESARGGGRASADWAQRLSGKQMPNYLRPDAAEELHNSLVAAGVVSGSKPAFAQNALKIILEEGVATRLSDDALASFQAAYPGIRTPTLEALGTGGSLPEKSFFDGVEGELFSLADELGDAAEGASKTVADRIEELAALARTLTQNTRIPLVSEVRLLAGERLASPVRAFLTTKYKIPSGLGETVGVSTPYGYLRPADLHKMIDDLGGFGPSRMDVARKGLMVNDFLLAASKEKKDKILDLVVGRQTAYAFADQMEEGFRRAVFAKALQHGKTPEAAIELARRSQFDYGGAKDSEIIEALSPYWAGVVNMVASGKEFVDKVAKNPESYSVYLRGLRTQQKIHDPLGEQGDTPLTRFYAPLPDGVTKDVFGKDIAVLGPEAPYLGPIDTVIGTFQALQTMADLAEIVRDGELMEKVFAGSADALDDLAEAADSVASGFAMEYEPSSAEVTERSGVKLSTDQTYLATLAIARAKDPDPDNPTGQLADTLRFLDPDVVKPPKGKAAYADENSNAWAERPPDAPDTFIFAQMEAVPGYEEKREVYYLLKPSKVGRARIQALWAAPQIVPELEQTYRAVGTGLDSGVGEGILWYLGADTVENPQKNLVESMK